MTQPIRWLCDFNRPLSREEKSMLARLSRAPQGCEIPKASFPWPPRKFFEQEFEEQVVVVPAPEPEPLAVPAWCSPLVAR